MASAKKCDRCGRLYEHIDGSKFDFNEEFWRYNIVKDCHPYDNIEQLDLCLPCWRDLYAWIKEGNNG